MSVTKSADTVTWTVDGTLIATVNLTNVTLGGGNIFFGQSDINAASPPAGQNAASLLFTLIDNVSVNDISPAVATWTNSAGGDFSTAANWQNSLHGINSDAIFNLSNSYAVTFSQNATTHDLHVQGGNVSMNLQSKTYSVINQIRVGGTSAELQLVNGDASSQYLALEATSGTAQLILDDASLTTNQGLCDIGVLGTHGRLTLMNDSLLQTGYVRIGENTGSTGLLTVMVAPRMPRSTECKLVRPATASFKSRMPGPCTRPDHHAGEFWSGGAMAKS